MDPEEKELNPYAAPAAIEAPAAEATPDVASQYRLYRDNRTLAAWLVGLLVLGALVNLARGGLHLAYTLTAFAADQKRVKMIEGIMNGLGFVMFACMIVFGIWIVRSAKNAWLFAEVARFRKRVDFQVQQTYLQDTPGWAVGWYFIPIANLWKPFVAMRDIVRASTMREGLPSFLLPTWWTLWILCNLADNSPQILNNPSFEWSATFLAAASAGVPGVQIALHLIAIVLVRAVTALQTDTAAAMAAATPADPLPSRPRRARLPRQE
ncbi:DUF4328 domain-containing protein [Luteolibacter soli]|uniref:DUF4328 domain-containing protein n=1 Tax=Luteolibacter soli TaxID=3135280 RepID=A0ABU9ASY6_9BACT